MRISSESNPSFACWHRPYVWAKWWLPGSWWPWLSTGPGPRSSKRARRTNCACSWTTCAARTAWTCARDCCRVGKPGICRPAKAWKSLDSLTCDYIVVSQHVTGDSRNLWRHGGRCFGNGNALRKALMSRVLHAWHRCLLHGSLEAPKTCG